MTIQLIHGQFLAREAIEIITQMIHVKIKFQENKIHSHSSEEDIKMRERRIRELQKDLYEARMKIEKSPNAEVSLSSEIIID